MENKTRTRKHWLILLIACGMAGSALGINMSVIGVFYQPVAEDLNILVGAFAFHSTLAAFALSFMSLFIPRLLDFFPLKKMVLFGILVASLSTIGMAFTSNVGVFYILGVIRGLSSGLLGPVTVTSLINNWFDEKNGMALSIAISFSGVVGVIMSPIFTWTIEAFGWRLSFVFAGLFIALFNLPTYLIPYSIEPKSEGLMPYGATEDANDDDEKEADTLETTDIKARKRVSYASLPFVTLCVVALLHTFSTGLAQNFPGFASSLGFSSAVGAAMLSVAMFSNIVSKLVFGAVAGKIGTIVTIIISLSLTVGALVLMIFIRQPFILMALTVVYGAAYFIPGVGLPLLTNYFYGKRTSNKIYPIFNFLAGTSAAVSLSLVGFVYDFTGSYLPAFWLAVGFSFICITLLVLSWNAVKKRETEKIKIQKERTSQSYSSKW